MFLMSANDKAKTEAVQKNGIWKWRDFKVQRPLSSAGAVPRKNTCIFIDKVLLMDFPGGTVVKIPPANVEDAGDASLIPKSGRPPGGGNGNPHQYSCLENPMNRGARWTAAHGVSKSQTRLSTHERLLLNEKTLGFSASRGEEFNQGPETRLNRSELLCNKVLLKYKGDRESFWHRHQKGAERVLTC